MKMFNGIVEINGRLAYAGESAWEINSLEDISDYVREVMAYVDLTAQDKLQINRYLRAQLKSNN